MLAEKKFSTFPPRSASKSLKYTPYDMAVSDTIPGHPRSRPSLAGFEFNLTPEPIGNGLDLGNPINWTSLGVSDTQLHSGIDRPFDCPKYFTFPHCNSTEFHSMLDEAPWRNRYPSGIAKDSQYWESLITEAAAGISPWGIQPIPQVSEENFEQTFGPKPLTTQKPLLFRRPTWKVPDEECTAREQEVGKAKTSMMWAREQDNLPYITVDQNGLQPSVPTHANDIFGIPSTGMESLMSVHPSTISSHFYSASGQPNSYMETGDIVPVESSKPEGPLQFKMPSALEAAMGSYGGFSLDYGMHPNVRSDGLMAAGMDMQAWKIEKQCPSYWGEEKGGVMGSFLGDHGNMTGFNMVTGFRETGLLGNDPCAYAFQPQPQPQAPRRRSSMRGIDGAHYQHGPIVAIPNVSARFQPYVKKDKSANHRQYAAPISCPMTPPKSSCLKNAVLAMQEETNNVDLQEEVEMMGYQMDENFDIPVANELLGRTDSWNGGDIFDLINGTVPPVVATMTESADAPSSPDEVPVSARSTNMLGTTELTCTSFSSDRENKRE